jgi:hypothetical protein
MPHDNEPHIEKGTGVGTDGSLHSAKEDFFDHGADHSPAESDGVGTDGSLVNPDKDDDVRDATDPAYPAREGGVNPHVGEGER